MIDQDIESVYIHSINGVYTLSSISSYINDIACNNITIGTVCEGSAQIITDPPGATIFIDGIRQQITTPATIDHIICTDPINKPNKFKLTLPGYRNEEGILLITSLNVPENPYILNITMDRISNEIGGLLVAALIVGAFVLFFQIEKEKKYEATT